MDLGLALGLEGIVPSLGTVYYFENSEHGEKRTPHYHIAIPTVDGGYVLLVMFTSQVEKKREYYAVTNQKAFNSLVFANETDFCFLTKESVIDCNNPMYKTSEELGAIIHNLEFKNADLTQDFIDEIVKAIKESPIARPHIKRALA